MIDPFATAAMARRGAHGVPCRLVRSAREFPRPVGSLRRPRPSGGPAAARVPLPAIHPRS